MRPAPVAPWLHTRTARPALSVAQVRRALWRGIRLRCPVCGEGKLFASFFRMRGECERCGVDFERESGQWLGSMDINLTLSLFLLLAPVVFLPEMDLGRELAFFGAGAVLLPIALFRFVRGVWTALVYLSGGVY